METLSLLENFRTEVCDEEALADMIDLIATIQKSKTNGASLAAVTKYRKRTLEKFINSLRNEHDNSLG